MRLLLLTICFALSSLGLFAQNSSHLTLPFKYCETKLNTQVKKSIDDAWEIMGNSSSMELKLLSDWERSLSGKLQKKLSKDRADSVAIYLQMKAIPLNVIKLKLINFEDCTVGFCRLSESDKKLRKKQGYYALVMDKPTYWKDQDQEPDYDLFTNNCQEYWITNIQDCVIKGKLGTEVNFPAGSFNLDYSKQSRPETRIKITLCEYYSKEDFVLASLTTTSQGALLVSGGTIFIKAEYLGRKIELDESKFIEILFPFKDSVDGQMMQTFNGEYNDGEVDWLVNENVEDATIYSPNAEIGVRALSSGMEDVLNPFANDSEEFGYNYERQGYFDAAGFFLVSNQLGWINCDRFYEYKDKIDLLVTNENSFPMTYRLVFKEMNSVMGDSYSGVGRGRFQGVPVGQEATIVGFANTSDGKVVFGKKRILVNSKNSFVLDTEIMSEAQFKNRVKSYF